MGLDDPYGERKYCFPTTRSYSFVHLSEVKITNQTIIVNIRKNKSFIIIIIIIILEEAVEEANANPDSDDEQDDKSQQETITNLSDYAYFDPE